MFVLSFYYYYYWFWLSGFVFCVIGYYCYWSVFTQELDIFVTCVFVFVWINESYAVTKNGNSFAYVNFFWNLWLTMHRSCVMFLAPSCLFFFRLSFIIARIDGGGGPASFYLCFFNWGRRNAYLRLKENEILKNEQSFTCNFMVNSLKKLWLCSWDSCRSHF